jgi:hypothetical protein
MKALFGLEADDYNELSTFMGHVEKIPKDIQDLVIKDLLILHKTSHYITSANEATRSEFISRIIYGVASSYDGDNYLISDIHIRIRGWKYYIFV